MKNKEIIGPSPYLIYLCTFLILFTFGIGIGFLRNNFKKSIQVNPIVDKSLIDANEKQEVSEKVISQEIKKNSFNDLKSSNLNTTENNLIKLEEIIDLAFFRRNNQLNQCVASKSNYLWKK